MVHNNGFPMGYQPVRPAPPIFNGNVAQYDTSQQYVPPQQNNSDRGGIVWVQGDAGARSFLVAPNQSVMLMDSEDSCFYIKSADASGMPLPLRIFDYKERVQNTNERNQAQSAQIDMTQYVTRDVFEAQLEDLAEQIRALSEDRNVSDQSAKRRK